MRKKVRTVFVSLTNFSKYQWKFYKSFHPSRFLRTKWRKSTLLSQILTLHRDSSRFHQREKHSSSTCIRYFCHAVTRRFFSIQLVDILKDEGLKERKQANSNPKTSSAIVAGPTNDHRVRETRKNKALRTKTIGDDSHPLSTSFTPSHPFSSLRIYAYLATPMLLKDANISLSFVASVRYLSLSFSQTARRFSCLISRLALRNTHCRFCSNRAPVIYDDPCLSRVFVSRFRVDNAPLPLLFEIIALFHIGAWSAAVFSTEKNPACSGLWQRWNTLNA